jgi:hypothetical protein
MSDEISMSECIESARKLGEANGKSAASWVFDGNTSHDTYVSVVRLFDEGDPAVYDYYREPSFSGEFSDSYSERDLADDLGIDYDLTVTEDIDALADAYLESARDAFWSEVERVAREHV